MQAEYTTPAPLSQVLDDVNSYGKSRPWAEHKRETIALSAIYETMGDAVSFDPDTGKQVEPMPHEAGRWYDRARALAGCAPWAEFTRDKDGRLHLYKSSFCRVRLCPMCQWRRSLKLGAQARAVVTTALQLDPTMRWLMLTVTVKNIPAAELGDAVDHIHASLTRLTHRKEWPALGWLRATEVTYNAKADTYHPHMHLLLAVKSSYFKGGNYLKKEDWIQLWRAAAHLDYDPSIDIHVIKPRDAADSSGIGKALLEVTKYSVKPSSYIVPWDIDASMRAIGTLDRWLDGRRLTSWGGLLKKIAQNLKLSDDLTNGDLIHLDPLEDASSNGAFGEAVEQYILYKWSVGLNNYQLYGVAEGAARESVRAMQRLEHESDHAAWLDSQTEKLFAAADIEEAIRCDEARRKNNDGRASRLKRAAT